MQGAGQRSQSSLGVLLFIVLSCFIFSTEHTDSREGQGRGGEGIGGLSLTDDKCLHLFQVNCQSARRLSMPCLQTSMSN